MDYNKSNQAELNELKRAANEFKAMLSREDMHAFEVRLDFSLKQILTAISALSITDKPPVANHDMFLFYKQLERAINDINFLVTSDSDANALAKSIYDSREFKALNNPVFQSFLISEKEEWYPHYLAHTILEALKNSEQNAPAALTNQIEAINSSKLPGKDKTEQITHVVSTYAKINNMIVFFDKNAALKKHLIKVIELEKQANIAYLNQTPSNKR
jgi:hypothetical protein